jgi:hypothetical protein
MRCCLWSIACCLLLTTVSHAEESIQVTVIGKLQTGVVAIGGETTGTTITARDITWELEFGKNDELRKAADKWNGQQVTVTGSLERRAGVEVKQRWIVTVSSLKGPEAAPKKKDGKQDEPSGTPTTGPLKLPNIRPASTQDGTTVNVRAERERTVIEIRCDRGIDRCVIHRDGEQWPETLIARLWLKGLESFKVHASGSELEWSVSSSGNPTSSVSLHSGLRSTRLTKDSAFFTTAKALAVDASQAKIPLQNGYFEVPIPAKLLEKNPAQVTLQWVDFYR